MGLKITQLVRVNDGLQVTCCRDWVQNKLGDDGTVQVAGERERREYCVLCFKVWDFGKNGPSSI